MPRSEGPKRVPIWRSRPAASVAAALLLFALLFSTLAGGLLSRKARELVERALGEGSSIARIELLGPTRLGLKGFETDGAAADEVVLQFAPGKLFTEGIGAALFRIDLVRPRLDVSHEREGGPAAAWPLLPPEVRVVDGALIAGETVLFQEIDAVVVREGDHFRFEVKGKEARPGGASLTSAGTLHLIEEELSLRVDGTGEVRGLLLGGARVDAAQFVLSVQLGGGGEAGDWRGKLTLTGGSGELYHVPFATLQGEATGGAEGWEFQRVELASARGARISAAGWLETAGELRLAIDLEAEKVPAPAALRWLTDREELLEGAGGTVDARLELKGSPHSLEVRGALQSASLRVHGAALSDLTAGFERAPGGGVSAWARGVSGGGLVELERLWWSEEEIDGLVRFEGVGAPALVRTVETFLGESPPLRRLSGRVDGRLQLGGRPGTLEVSGNVSAKRLRWANLPLEPVELEGGWSPQGWVIRRASALPGEAGPLLVAEGAGGKEHGEAKVRFQELPMEWLRRLWNAPLLPGLSGVVDGTLHLAVSGNTLGLSGEAAVRGTVDGTPLAGEVAGSAHLGGEWSLRGTLVAGDGWANISGSGAPEGPAEVQASVERFPAQVAAGLWAVGPMEGALEGLGAWRRERGGWSLQGELTSAELHVEGLRLAGAHLRFDLGRDGAGEGAPQECPACLAGEVKLSAGLSADGVLKEERVTLVAEFLGDRVQLRPTVLRLGGGRVALEGSARLEEDGWTVDLRSRGEGIALRREGISVSDLLYQLELAGPFDALALTGSVDVGKGELDLFSLGRRPGAGTPIPVHLGVDLSLKSARIRARSLLDTELSGDLALRGTVSRPALQGELALNRSSFWYLGSRFRAEGGSLAFTGVGLIPRVSVTGALRKPGRSVYAHVEGPVDALEIALSSDPPLEERELLELIGVPTQWSLDETGGWAGLASALATWVDRELVSDVYWRLGRALQERFDLDALEIESNGAGGARLLLGKYVTPELYLSYDWELASGSSGGFGLEYTLARYIRLKSAWSRKNGTEVGIAATIPF